MFSEEDSLHFNLKWNVYNNFFDEKKKYCDFCLIYFDSYVNDNIVKVIPQRKILEKCENKTKYINFFEGSIDLRNFFKTQNFEPNFSLKSYYDYKKYVYNCAKKGEVPKDTILNIICFKYTKDVDGFLITSQVGSSCIHLYDIYERAKKSIPVKGDIKYHDIHMGSYILDMKKSKISFDSKIKWMEYTDVNSLNDFKIIEELKNEIKNDLKLFRGFKITTGVSNDINVLYNKNMVEKTPLESFILSNVNKVGSKFIEETLKYAIKRFSVYKNYKKPEDFENDEIFSKIWFKLNFEDKCNVICFFFSFPTIFIKYKNDVYDYDWKNIEIDDYTKNSMYCNNGDCDDKMQTILSFIKTIQYYNTDKNTYYFEIINEIKEILKLYIPMGNVWLVDTDRYSKKKCGHWNVVLIPIDYFMKNISLNTDIKDKNIEDTIEKIKEISEREIMMFNNNIKKLKLEKEKINIINIEGTNIYPNYIQEDIYFDIKNQFSKYESLARLDNIIIHGDNDDYNFFLFSCIGVTLYFLERYKLGITKFYYMDQTSGKEKYGVSKKNFFELRNFNLKINTIKSDKFIDVIYSKSKYNESIISYISKIKQKNEKSIDKYEKFDIKNKFYTYEYENKTLKYVGYDSENPINDMKLVIIEKISKKIEKINKENKNKKGNCKNSGTISSSMSLDLFTHDIFIDRFFDELTEISVVYNVSFDIYTILNRTLLFFYISFNKYA